MSLTPEERKKLIAEGKAIREGIRAAIDIAGKNELKRRYAEIDAILRGEKEPPRSVEPRPKVQDVEPKDEADRIPCPYCGEKILADAKKCRYCGEWLQPEKSPSTPSAEVKPPAPSAEVPKVVGALGKVKQRASENQQKLQATGTNYARGCAVGCGGILLFILAISFISAFFAGDSTEEQRPSGRATSASRSTTQPSNRPVTTTTQRNPRISNTAPSTAVGGRYQSAPLQVSRSEALLIIRQKAQRDWPNDFSMQEFLVKQQKES